MKWYPLNIESGTNEPYIQLPAPHAHIIITPPRLSDAPDIVTILNDERVYKWLRGPPFPFLLKDAEHWLAIVKSKSDILLKEFQEANGDEWKLFDGCPVQILREVKEDGTQLYLGDVSFLRCRWIEEKDLEKKRQLIELNESRPIGDPRLIWGVGGKCNPFKK
jgi:hypothetical protein